MPRWVNIHYRIVQHVGEPIPTLRVARIRNNGIRLRESTEGRIVIPRIVEIQLHGGGRKVLNLPREAALRGRGRLAPARLAKGFVAQFAPHRPIAFEDDARPTKVVIQQVIEGRPFRTATRCLSAQ